MKNISKEKSKKAKKFFEYKGKPLVRCKNTIYYGDINDKYVVKIENKKTKKIKDVNVSTLVTVEMIDTDENTPLTKKIVKTSEKAGLYLALDIANAWIERAATNN